MVLSKLRSKKFAKKILIAILILIIPAFVLWGVGSLSDGPELIGTINGQKINTDDFSKSLQGIKAQVLFSQFVDQKAMNTILQNRPMMNWMAWERLVFLNAAKKSGIKVSNNDVLSFIATHPLFQRGGSFDRRIYEHVLKNNLSLEPRKFEELVRENLTVRTLRQKLLENVYISEVELSDYYATANSKIDISYIFIDPSSFKDESATSEEDAREYFNKSKFMTPPKAIVDFIELPYKNASEKQQAVRTLEKLYPELAKAPGSFTETAEKNGFAVKKSSPFAKEELVQGVPFFAQFNSTALSLPEGTVSVPLFSGPGETGMAYVLLKAKNVASRPLEFSEVEPALKTFLSEKKSLLLAQESAAKMFARISNNTVTLENASEEIKSTLTKRQDITISEYIENIGPATEIVLAAVQKKETGLLDPITLQKGVILVRVDSITPPDMSSFDEQKETIRQQLLKRKQLIALDKWYKDRSDRIKLKKRLEEI